MLRTTSITVPRFVVVRLCVPPGSHTIRITVCIDHGEIWNESKPLAGTCMPNLIQIGDGVCIAEKRKGRVFTLGRDCEVFLPHRGVYLLY